MMRAFLFVFSNPSEGFLANPFSGLLSVEQQKKPVQVDGNMVLTTHNFVSFIGLSLFASPIVTTDCPPLSFEIDLSGIRIP